MKGQPDQEVQSKARA